MPLGATYMKLCFNFRHIYNEKLVAYFRLKVCLHTVRCLCVAGLVRASSLFPILSTILLLLGGLCVGVGHVYSSRNNIILSAGILFVSAGTMHASNLNIPPVLVFQKKIPDESPNTNHNFSKAYQCILIVKSTVAINACMI